MTPRSGNRVSFYEENGLDFAADNDCFNGFNERRYRMMVDRVRESPRLMWVVAPGCSSGP